MDVFSDAEAKLLIISTRWGILSGVWVGIHTLLPGGNVTAPVLSSRDMVAHLMLSAGTLCV